MTHYGKLLATLTVLASTALAENKPAPATTPAAQPAAPAPAVAATATPVPTAAQIALARDVIQAVGQTHQIEAVITQFRQFAAKQSASIAPAGTATEAQKKAVETMIASLNVLANEAVARMMATYEKAYLDVFSPVELTAIRNFYLSPEGRAFIAKQPQLQRAMGPSLQQFQEELDRKLTVLIEQARRDAGQPATAPAAPAAPAAQPAPAAAQKK